MQDARIISTFARNEGHESVKFAMATWFEAHAASRVPCGSWRPSPPPERPSLSQARSAAHPAAASTSGPQPGPMRGRPRVESGRLPAAPSVRSWPRGSAATGCTFCCSMHRPTAHCRRSKPGCWRWRTRARSHRAQRRPAAGAGRPPHALLAAREMVGELRGAGDRAAGAVPSNASAREVAFGLHRRSGPRASEPGRRPEIPWLRLAGGDAADAATVRHPWRGRFRSSSGRNSI